MSELRILVVDDSIDDTELATIALTRAGYLLTVLRVDTHEDLSEAVFLPWDLCLVDWVMPSMTAPEVIRFLRSSYENPPPCIIWSGGHDSKLAWAAVEVLLVEAFLHKNDYATLPALVEKALG